MMIDPRALSVARNWLGTPHVPMASKRQVGCDCIGLVRGVFEEIEDRPAPGIPPLARDWFGARGRPLVTALRTHLTEIPVTEAGPGPGTVIVIRVGGRREVHCGIIEEDGRLIHAMEGPGVVRVPVGPYLKTARFAAAFSSARKEFSR